MKFSYIGRSNHQLTEWVKGNSVHNDADNECCPDFSCCQPRFLADKETRKLFKAAFDQKRPDIVSSMLMDFLVASIKANCPDIKINITNRDYIYLNN